ncbi:hypothetical protein ACQP1W_46680 [Spirillospora sp. CA-255316]
MPAVVVRRLGWKPVRGLVLVLAVIGVVLLALAWVWTALLPVALAALAGAGFLVAVTVRARTEIGPDGIRNRPLRKETFIPWDDITDVVGMESAPRVITVVRAGKDPVTLAAVRDDGTAPDGLGFDDLVALVRERARGGGSDRDEPVPPAEPLSLRPSRRPLIWLLPVFAVGAWSLLTDTFGGSNLAFAFGYLAAVVLFQALLILKLLFGFTEADGSGLRNRLIFKTRTVPWSEVGRLSVMPTLFGRIVQVEVRDGKGLFLAAPRDGLLGRDPGMAATLEAMRALAGPGRVKVVPNPVRTVRGMLWGAIAFALCVAVAIGQPWLEHWWPGRAEADKIPRACSVIDPATRQRMLPGPVAPERSAANDSFSNYNYSAVSRCLRADEDGNTLSLDLDLSRRVAFGSATDEARDEMALERKFLGQVPAGRPGPAPVRGLGDEAWRTVWTEDGETEVDVLVRYANVVIKVDYGAERPAAQVEADAIALVRATMARIGT